MNEKKHIQVAAALLFGNGKIFATKRGDSPYSYVAHKYEFPGGKIEKGERGEDAVKRELEEELDLEVKVGGLYASHTHEYPDFIITLWLYECEMCSDFHLKEHESYAGKKDGIEPSYTEPYSYWFVSFIIVVLCHLMNLVSLHKEFFQHLPKDPQAYKMTCKASGIHGRLYRRNQESPRKHSPYPVYGRPSCDISLSSFPPRCQL